MPGKHNAGGCSCCGECWLTCNPASIELTNTTTGIANSCCDAIDGTYAIGATGCVDSYRIDGTIDVNRVYTDPAASCLEANCYFEEVAGTEFIRVCDTAWSFCTHTWIMLALVFVTITRTRDAITGALTISVSVQYRYASRSFHSNDSGPSGARCGPNDDAGLHVYTDNYELELAGCEEVVDLTEIPYVSRTLDQGMFDSTSFNTSGGFLASYNFPVCDPATIVLRV